mgnify:FL=1|tara:strand:- start:3740 stop:4951 length:1212 start_codon:yes stop_codon:yes gene_type:complete
MTAPANSQTPTPLLIVIPVYRDLAATRQCIESVIASELPENTSVLIIDDHSPEQDTRDYCREITDNSGFSLLVNETNLGFVASANRGMQFREDADVILLNSDTLVCADWAARMQRCAGSDEAIGTVTPFSNNGTICSYPMFNHSNPLPPQWTAAQLDNAFSHANASLYAEIPTAVGFCMLIKRECLSATGYFDEERFGQGYGEECDFSLRASARGWKHVVAADVFVFHQGAASFAESSTGRKQAADDIIGKLHPQYHELVSQFIERDPLLPLRNRIDAWRMEERAGDRIRVLEEHDRYRQALTAELREQLSKARKAAEAYRLQVIQEREQGLQLLEDCRQRFEQTDSALAQAEQVVADLKQDIQALKQGIENEQRYAASLKEKIDLMEQSRSWRYTRWLRRDA